ncbi:hypothetical protein GQ43DRAFT_436741 [Delitschia confertaspora ATCC 74209]|uniref:Uncharacterized protein n=1 Tax=Delitschia confertaspora ATCC 74209 TaxID=1513339 RepID=A0A9P4JWH4_9PLEO|nr:hypothetical protein GQ43DRAFT_436741 [Delitschia confertaspora ATCC 74209]
MHALDRPTRAPVLSGHIDSVVNKGLILLPIHLPPRAVATSPSPQLIKSCLYARG